MGPLDGIRVIDASAYAVGPWAGALLGMLPLLSGGAEIPEPVLPAGVGVNIHFVTGRGRLGQDYLDQRYVHGAAVIHAATPS